jgi:hypothetical protein
MSKIYVVYANCGEYDGSWQQNLKAFLNEDLAKVFIEELTEECEHVILQLKELREQYGMNKHYTLEEFRTKERIHAVREYHEKINDVMKSKLINFNHGDDVDFSYEELDLVE